MRGPYAFLLLSFLSTLEPCIQILDFLCCGLAEEVCGPEVAGLIRRGEIRINRADGRGVRVCCKLHLGQRGQGHQGEGLAGLFVCSPDETSRRWKIYIVLIGGKLCRRAAFREPAPEILRLVEYFEG